MHVFCQAEATDIIPGKCRDRLWLQLWNNLKFGKNGIRLFFGSQCITVTGNNTKSVTTDWIKSQWLSTDTGKETNDAWLPAVLTPAAVTLPWPLSPQRLPSYQTAIKADIVIVWYISLVHKRVQWRHGQIVELQNTTKQTALWVN